MPTPKAAAPRPRMQVEKHGLPQHAPGILLAVGPEVLGDLDRKGGVQAHQDAVEQPGAGADDADGGGGLCADVAHHGGVDVLHGRDHQLLQNGRDAQRQRDAGRVGQRDGPRPAASGPKAASSESFMSSPFSPIFL